MSRIFDMDNPFFRAMSRLADLFILNFIFIICCIPIITIGPALAAMFYVTLKMVQNKESYIIRSFLHSFKQNLKQGIVIHLILVAVGIIFILDFRIMSQMQGALYSAFRVLLMALLLVYAMVYLYIYPIQAKFYNSIKNTFRNALLMSIRHLPYTILMLAISAIPVAVLFIPEPRIQSAFMMALLVVGPPAIAYSNSFFLRKIFAIYAPEEDEVITDDFDPNRIDELFPEDEEDGEKEKTEDTPAEASTSDVSSDEQA